MPSHFEVANLVSDDVRRPRGHGQMAKLLECACLFWRFGVNDKSVCARNHNMPRRKKRQKGSRTLPRGRDCREARIWTEVKPLAIADQYMRNGRAVIQPVPIDGDLKNLITDAAHKTHLTQAEVMRTALRIGVP